MDAAMWGLIGSLIGTIIGASASIITTVISNSGNARLQKNNNLLEREERARSFQRENLLTIQEIVQDLVRLAGKSYIEDVQIHLETGSWGTSPLSHEVNEQSLLLNRKLFALVERIADDSLRSKIKEMHKSIVEIFLARTQGESEHLLNKINISYATTMEHLGTILRSNY